MAAFFGSMEAGFRKMQEDLAQQVCIHVYFATINSDQSVARVYCRFRIAISSQERGACYALKGPFSDGKRA
jgi:hypothetical protein